MYEREMRKCFRLARKGKGQVSPNPLVGCVVLDKSGKEISNGYHRKYGENHAERDALLKLMPDDTAGGTLIVNLEPCNHYGKTPPCSDLIIKYGISRVVISTLDPNPKAYGGKEKLEKAGIEVISGVLREEGEFLNRIFFNNIKNKRAYLVLKTATTIDGKIGTSIGDSKWITSEGARKLSRKFRQEYDAIMTTSATVLADNPQMRHRQKIILDRDCRLDFNLKIFKQGNIILFNGDKKKYNQTIPSNVQIINVKEINSKLDLKEVLKKIYEIGIMSVFIEAGSKLNGEIIKQDLADEIIQFTAPKILNDNTGLSCYSGDSVEKISESKIYELKELKLIYPDYYARYIRKL